jgi:hypothetical protein
VRECVEEGWREGREREREGEEGGGCCPQYLIVNIVLFEGVLTRAVLWMRAWLILEHLDTGTSAPAGMDSSSRSWHG